MSETAEAGRGVKRYRQACLNCRRKKVRCHAERPSCSFCARLGQECIYPGGSQPAAGSVPSQQDSLERSNGLNDLASRIAAIEARLNSLATSPDSNSKAELASTVNDMQSLFDWAPEEKRVSDRWQPKAEPSLAFPLPRSNSSGSVIELPGFEVQKKVVDAYFKYCHNQPYCFFHEQCFRHRLNNGTIPEYLLLAVMSIASRFVPEANWPTAEQQAEAAAQYASKAWNEVFRQSFENEESLDWRVVQAATLLSIYDFTASKHNSAWIKIGLAVSLAQSLHMMIEPDSSLSIAGREEHRRTLWSVYLLDKITTTGRGRPSLFLDETCRLQLPCSESAFRASKKENVISLEQFKRAEDDQIRGVDSLARTVAITSTLGLITAYVFQQNSEINRKPPWDHASEFQIACSQLTRFETIFDHYHPIQQTILADSTKQPKTFTESFIFSYVQYQICSCLLYHPFLLRRQLEESGNRVPISFLNQALQSGWNHAQELTDTLANAKIAGYRVGAPFLSYGSHLAGTIHCLFQYSTNKDIRQKSIEGLKKNLTHLSEKAGLWQNSVCMESALRRFSVESIKYSDLVVSGLRNVPLDADDIDYLFSYFWDFVGQQSRDHTLENTIAQSHADTIPRLNGTTFARHCPRSPTLGLKIKLTSTPRYS
ncbi:fungal-specific transcription factor domain-containing protein [Acrodontium crateriforme]|uniref:Fungal-specific transcription factor domain-containing protein n=1 Tax=Acrodontium crateriforme TaxID=150365 RepID=A0AAQ3R377_9PEZI|nr:fungal-specific transcription factor domain-containing protein [Acrodontium crateriforme]